MKNQVVCLEIRRSGRQGRVQKCGQRDLTAIARSLFIARTVVLLLVALMGLMTLCQRASAQTQSGLSTIQGTVTDSTGAVIRSASIQVVNKATGVASAAKSNEAGFYQVPGLVTGTYNLTVTASGMKTHVFTVELQSAQTAVVNPVMAIGAVTDKVEVTASIVQLTDTNEGGISSVLENQRINQLPMNLRNITTLTQETTPGLEAGFGPGSRANGLAGEAMEYVADGAPLNNRNFGGPNASAQAQYPDPDAVQEVRVEVSAGGAQYATPATGIITTKSGTNQIHGTAFWTGENNSAAGVAKARQNPATFAAPNFKRNEFGVSAGGPVILPHVYHGKDKTFWFFAYERYSLRQSVNQFFSIDTPAMAGGDFSGLTTTQLYDPSTTAPNAACPTPGVVSGVTIWNAGPTVNNPYCRTPFGNGIMGDSGNNKIPATQLNHISKIIYDMTPAPNVSGVINPTLASNYIASLPNLYTIPTITWRLDHNFNESNKTYMRYTSNLQSSQYPGGFVLTPAADGIPAGAAGGETILPVDNFAGAVGYTHIFSPTFFSETVVSQQWFSQFVTETGDPHRNYEQELGLPNNFGYTGFPAIGGFIMAHGGNQYDYGISQITSTIDENLTKTWGKHQMHFGLRYRHERLGYQMDFGNDQDSADNLSTALYDVKTGGTYGALANTGASAASAFMGSMYNFTANEIPPYAHNTQMEVDAYFQDDYHIRRNLTLDIGLRWEDHPAINMGGYGESFDMPNHAIVLEHPISYYVANGRVPQALATNMQNIGVKYETPSTAPRYNGSLFRSFPLIIEPRVGFAWQPFGEKRGTVVRGAYGRYTFPEALRDILTARQLPFFNTYGYNNNSASQDPDGIANYELRNKQNIFNGQNTANLVPTNGTNVIQPGLGGNYFDHDFPPEGATEADFTIEQQFKDNSALHITWNWTHGTNLTDPVLPNVSVGAFVWELATGTLPPQGGVSAIGTNQFQATALGPYDNITYGNFYRDKRNGWSNDNSLQVNYQRLFHRGVAFQAMYVWSRPFRVGSNSTRDSVGTSTAAYPGVIGVAPGATYGPLPGEGPMTLSAPFPAAPAGTPTWDVYKALTKYQLYKVDPYFSGLFHHVTITGLYDLPVGRGKWLLGNSNRLVNEIVGGWQIAGDGQVKSQNFSPSISYWGQFNGLKTYKKSVPIVDCQSGKCLNRYMWFNGYISPKFLLPANGGICDPNAPGGNKCVTGLPADYVPYMTPINNNPNIAANFGNNNVQITVPTLNGGQPLTTPYLTTYNGNHPTAKSVLTGPFNYIVDLSLFKVFPITERVNIRANVDAFNAFNIMGFNNPNTASGELSDTPGGVDGSSYWTPRQLQLTLRVTF